MVFKKFQIQKRTLYIQERSIHIQKESFKIQKNIERQKSLHLRKKISLNLKELLLEIILFIQKKKNFERKT